MQYIYTIIGGTDRAVATEKLWQIEVYACVIRYVLTQVRRTERRFSTSGVARPSEPARLPTVINWAICRISPVSSAERSRP